METTNETGTNPAGAQSSAKGATLSVGLAATRFGIPEKCDYDPYMSGCGYIVQPEGRTKCPQADACIKCAEIVAANA